MKFNGRRYRRHVGYRPCRGEALSRRRLRWPSAATAAALTRPSPRAADVLALQADLRRPAGDAAIEAVRKRHGRIDILFANAGAWSRWTR